MVSPERVPAGTATALIVINGDDVYEELFGAADAVTQALSAAGFATRSGAGTARFSGTDAIADLIVLCTATGSFGGDQRDGLAARVRGGAGLMAIHASAVDPAEVLGVRYLSHGPQPHESTFTVEVDQTHELGSGLDPFEVTHEHYRLGVDSAADVVAWRRTEGGREPLLIVREVGNGRVVYLQLGHDLRVWSDPSVLRLLSRGARWAARMEVAA